jgi:succinate dehydrogenase/fumarate reductase flavoprotein subunit
MITSKQYWLMRKILKKNGTTAQDYENHDIYLYLSEKGFLRKQAVRGYMGYVVTQDGEVAMEAYRDDVYRYRITTLISLIALITSIFSLIIGSK